MPYLLRDLKKKYTEDPVIRDQLTQEFGDYSQLESEFDLFWEKHIEEVINESSMGNGHIAGAGAVDYNESKVLYFYVRTIKPKNVLEIGHASGCSSVVLAAALEANNENGHLYTCDIKGNAVEKPTKNFITSFGRYIDSGRIKATSYIDAIEYVKELDVDVDFIFIDASHEPEFCYPMASLLKKKYPNVLTTYHEWAMSPLATKEEFSYVSLPVNLQHQKMAEREAFLQEYSALKYDHFGFYGSCGLGVVKLKDTQPILKVYYRLSNLQAGVPKTKVPYATKQYCLSNAIKVFGSANITVIGDNLNKETEDMVNSLGLRLVKVDNSSGAGTFRDALDLAVKENSDEQAIYLLEDDFLHKPEAATLIMEGLENFDAYVTGYDHPDKYIDKEHGGNPFIESGGETTRLVRTKNSHWKITNSTVMSFAASRKRLKEDQELLHKYSADKITDSFRFFLELAQVKGVACISSVPGVSTHTEAAWLSPFTNWEEI